MRLLRPALAAFLSLGLVLGGCGPTTSAGPSTGASLRAERDQSRELVAELRRRDMLIEDRALNAYVGSVAQKIDRVRPQGAPKLRTFVVKDAGVNAFTTGGGFVFVTAGLLGAMENEAQFAFVMAHEIAHIDRGHVSRGARQREMASGLAALGAIAAAVAGVPPELARVGAGLGAQYAVADFSREQETEADAVGMRYLAGAGWNGLEGAESFAVLGRLYGEARGASAWFASHPAASDRQVRLGRLAREMGATEGRVAAGPYLKATEPLRRDLLKFYERQGRTAEARQARRNLRAGR